MHTSRFFLAALKETPADAEVVSHQLMLRAGMIRRTAAGVYSWLPLGLRVVQKVAAVIREEMNNAGAQEVLLPSVHPAELWQQSGRWNDYGPELLRFKDRHQREFCYGPTHEEVIAVAIKSDIRSYRQLPMNLYQIQTKFRDEIRPRFGVMRSREFIMKDAYSFDVDKKGLNEAYQIMYDAYIKVFARLSLEAVPVAADSGSIGGDYSHEFHVLADSGEDGIAICKAANYAANVELVPLPAPDNARPDAGGELQVIDTPNVHTVDELAKAAQVSATQIIKTLLVQGEKGPVAIILRGDHELNAVKAQKLDLVKSPIQFSSAAEIRTATGADAGSIGPVGLTIPIIADQSVLNMADFVCGANENDKHYTHVNWGRDLPEPQVADLRKAIDGDPCPDQPDASITIRRGIEVGHVFQLGLKYSQPLELNCLDEQGKKVPIYMGSYGIGVTRVVAAAIEQNHDDMGIVWPAPLAPFDVCIVPIGLNKSDNVAKTVKQIYDALREAGMDVLLDDRNERPGVMFAEMDLIGIPHRLVIGERGLDQGIAEYRNRATGEKIDIPLPQVVEFLLTKSG